MVYRISHGHVWVADPGQGKIKRSHEDFRTEWSGYAVFLTPTPEFKPNLERKGLFARFLPLFQPHWGVIIQAVLSSLVITALGILGSFYFAYLVDEVIPSQSKTALHDLSVGVSWLRIG